MIEFLKVDDLIENKVLIPNSVIFEDRNLIKC